MPITNSSFLSFAYLAQAAYADFLSSRTLLEALRRSGFGDFTATQADRFLGPSSNPGGASSQGFELKHHFGNDQTGFSASVFLNRSTGEYVLSIRGTEQPIVDVAEDLNRIGFQGFAGDQAVSLYRYFKSASTPPGVPVSYTEAEVRLLLSMRAGVPLDPAARSGFAARLRAELASDRGLVAFNGVDGQVIPTGSIVTATGHSLGGHLALLSGRLFPDIVGHVYTYNAPGISTNGERLLRLLGVQAIAPGVVTNFASGMGSELVSRIWGKPGASIGINTESGNLLHTHSIVPLTDAIALYSAIGVLSPDLSANHGAISRLIAASSPRSESSLESTLDFLRVALGFAPGATQIATGVADLSQRENYYSRLYGMLDGRVAGHDYGIKFLGDKTAVELARDAHNDAAVRYALNELMPFAVVNADYSEFDKVFSAGWLSARAEMLSAVVRRNLDDLPFLSSGASESYFFEDRASGMRIAVLSEADAAAGRLFLGPDQAGQLANFLRNVPYAGSTVFGPQLSPDGEVIVGLAGADRLFGNSRDDHLEGGAGNDYLEGGAGSDDLFGGAGKDVLNGGAGADWLAGGAGFDTYSLGASLEADTIVDRDGLVFAGTTVLRGGTREGDGAYTSSDGLFTFSFAGDLEVGGTLVVNGTLRIEGFVNGDLGIQLLDGIEEPDAGPPSTSALLLGDVLYEAFVDSADQFRDEFGNPRLTAYAVPWVGRSDTDSEFRGTPGNTHFDLGAGNDRAVDQFDGDDWIELGPGDDFGSGGAGNDLLEGGSGGDLLHGGEGDDVLIAGSLATLEADLEAAADPALPASRRESLLGGAGDDTIYGSGLGGVLEGGEGNDLILGGVEGDSIHGGTHGDASVAGDDTIDAGAGNDVIRLGPGSGLVRGGAGNDTIDAILEEGASLIRGDEGSDWITVTAQVPGGALVDIEGGSGNDNISATGVGGIVSGGDGRDMLYAYGPAMLDGGPGNDLMWFGVSDAAGVQSVPWGRGFGYDVGSASQGTFTILMAGDVAPFDVSVRWDSRPLSSVVAENPDSGPAPGPGELPGTGPGGPEGPLPPPPQFTGIEFSINGTDDAILVQASTLPQASKGIQIQFADGTVWDDAHIRSLLAPVAGEDLDPVPRISGSAADDLSYGSVSADVFASSAGNDWLLGGSGNDVYEHAEGDGFDWIEDIDPAPGNRDTLRFADGVLPSGIEVFSVGEDYVLALGDGGVRLRQGRTGDGAIERIEFADGTLWEADDLAERATLLPDNRAPGMPVALADVVVEPGETIDIVIPRDEIVDPDRFDSLSYYAVTSDGERLPPWLSFDPAALTITGAPTEAEAGDHQFLIIAADSNGAVAFSSLSISVAGEDAVAPDDSLPRAGPVEDATPASTLVMAGLPSPMPDVLEPAAPVLHDEPETRVGIPLDPLYREMSERFDVLLQVGRANLTERYAEAVREFEERRRQREAPAEPPPPTEEEVMEWNRAMHAWHDRHTGFTDVDGMEQDGVWATGWAGGGGERSFDELLNAGNAPGLANPGALPHLGGAARPPGLTEGIRDLR